MDEIGVLLGRAVEARDAGNTDLEIATYEQIREIDPLQPDAHRALAELYTVREDWRALAAVLLDTATENPSALATVAKMYEDQVGDAQAAFLVWITAVRTSPASALDDLARVAAAVDGWDDVRELAEELEGGHPEAAARVWRMIAARTGDRTALAHACRLVPTDRESFSNLGTALRGESRWRDLAALLARGIENEEDRERRANLCVELGELYETKLEQPDEAITWYERARVDVPELAVAELHRLYRAREAWPKIAPLVPYLLASSNDVELHVSLAEVLERVGDTEHAIAAYRAILALDAEHRGALEALARICDGDARREMLERLVARTTAPKPRADLLQRLGHCYLRDPAKARVYFAQSLALDLGNANTREGMARVHEAQNELVAAGEEWTRAAQLSDGAEKIRRYMEATRVNVALRDLDRAQQCVKEILELDPEHPDARRLLHETKQWDRLWPLLEADIARDPSPESYLRAARVALERGDNAKALELYELAGPEALAEYADALARCDRPGDAAMVYEKLPPESLDRAKLVAVYLKLDAYEKVLELDPKHRRALEALAEQHLAARRHDEAILKLRAILEVASAAGSQAPMAGSQADDRVGVLERIGDLYRDATFDAPRAIATYEEALAIDPKNHRILQRMLDLQCATAQWVAAIDTIARFIAHEADPVKRGMYHFAAAEIRRFELNDRVRAIVAYAHALEDLFAKRPVSTEVRSRALEIFRTLAELVAEDKNWSFLEELFVKMISRLPENDPAQAVLWQSLGELYHGPIDDAERAIVAFEKAHALDASKSPQRAAILADLYATHAKTRDPSHPDTIRVRGRSALHAGRIDEAWCAARALVFLDKANAEEQTLYARYQNRQPATPLDDDAWKLVRHPDEDPTISRIFALTWFGPMVAAAKPAKTFEIKPKQRLEDTHALAKVFRQVARVLAVKLPDVYVQDRVGHVWFANCVDDKGLLAPAIVVGRDMPSGDDAVAWISAFAAMLIPSYVLRLALPNVDDLEAGIAAAAQLCGRRIGREHLVKQRDRFADGIAQRLGGKLPDALPSLVGKLPDKLDLARWRDALGMTARRAALIVSGSLSSAVRLVAREGGAPDAAQLHDLVTYSVSPAYFAARAHLGVQVGG